MEKEARVQWIVMGLAWLITIMSILLPLKFHSLSWLYFVAAILVAVTYRITKDSITVIRGNLRHRAVLKALQGMPDTYYLMSDVNLDGGNKIDYLLLSTAGIKAFRIKSHLGLISGNEQDNEWIQRRKSEEGQVYAKKIPNPLAEFKNTCGALKELILNKTNEQVPVLPVMIFISAKEIKVESETPVIKPAMLKKVLEETSEQGAIPQEKVESIVRVITEL